VKLVCALLLLPLPALANGTISGTVRAEHAPTLASVKIAKDPTVCGQEAARDMLVVGSDGALANVVVSLWGV
jgi:hypothetical protein